MPQLLLLLAFGCHPADSGEAPEPICRTPGPSTGDWYTEASEDFGLADAAAVEPVATSVVAGDLDNDGWVDLFAALFPSQREPDPMVRTRFLLMNRPDPADPSRRVFVDVIDDSGLLATRDGAGGRGITTVTFGDLDNDGDLDVVGCAAEISTLFLDGCAAFENDGTAHFTLFDGGTLEDDLFSVPSSVLLDYDRDGILDLWPGTVGNWQYGPAHTSVPRLYRGNGDGTFREVSQRAGLPDELFTAADYRTNFGLTSCDVDLDGDRDVLIGNYGVPVGPNRLYRNDDGDFVDVAAELGVEKADAGGFTFSITCGDLEDDGDVDLMTAEVAHPGQGTDTSAVLLSSGDPDAAYARADSVQMGIGRPAGDMEGDNIGFFADIDLDGRKDLLVLSSNYPQQSDSDDEYTRPYLFRQTDAYTFEDVSDQTPFARPKHQTLEGGALADLDNDGDLDFAVGKGLFNSTWIADNLGITTAALSIYRNEKGQESNWTRIRLVGTGPSNHSGIGAQVTLTASGRTQYQEVLGSWGHSNTQSDVTLTFGLGDACLIDSLEVRWPDAAGTVTTFSDLLANYPIVITEGSDAVEYLVP